jgi:NADH dehydrogenase
MAQRIVVLGAGFAGLWSAIGAARALDAYGIKSIEILVIDRTAHHSIRVRNYEADLAGTWVSLNSVLDPIGVRHLQADITGIDVASRTVTCTAATGQQVVPYDRLVCALGSRLARPPIPGLETCGFDVDTYEAGQRLNDHIAALPAAAPTPGQYTVLVVGAGLTGIEAAAEMPAKLRAALGPQRGETEKPRVILADRQPWIGSDMGEDARPVIAEALRSLDIETRTGVSLTGVDPEGATLSTGEHIPSATVVWCAGMQANPLTALFPVERDRLGRLPVDEFLKIKGLGAEFAAGDAASLRVDGTHQSVMSCQHSRPMGRFAGHNAVCDLTGHPMLPLRIDWYTTILDLGAWGAVYTEGWDRKVVSTGMAAKRTKEIINRERIYPPRSGDRRAILDAAEPVVQAPPLRFH